MKSTIKFAALGVCALAATSTAALAQQIPAGFTAGLDLASPLPTGLFALDINAVDAGSKDLNLAATTPAIIYSSPYTIAGGKVGLFGLFAYGDVWGPFGSGGGGDGPWASIIQGEIKWNFGALSVGEHAGLMYLFGPNNFTTPAGLKQSTNFVGDTDFAYKFGGGLEGLLNVKYGNANIQGTDNNAWLTLEGALLKSFGKASIGPLLVYSTSLSGSSYDQTYIGGKVGYNFDGFTANFRVMQSVDESGKLLATGATGPAVLGSDTKVFVDFIKPLWVAEESLK